jgi:hypothetical protein
MVVAIDIDKIAAAKINLQQYILLYSIVTNHLEIYIKYLSNIYSIEEYKKDVNYLVANEFLVCTDTVDYSLESLLVTSKWNTLENADSNYIWNEFISVYPTVTPNNRRLKVDITQNKKRYLKQIQNSISMHQIVMQALKDEIKDRTINNSMNYFPMLTTYINQKRWESYINSNDDRNSSREWFNKDI